MPKSKLVPAFDFQDYHKCYAGKDTWPQERKSEYHLLLEFSNTYSAIDKLVEDGKMEDFWDDFQVRIPHCIKNTRRLKREKREAWKRKNSVYQAISFDGANVVIPITEARPLNKHQMVTMEDYTEAVILAKDSEGKWSLIWTPGVVPDMGKVSSLSIVRKKPSKQRYG